MLLRLQPPRPILDENVRINWLVQILLAIYSSHPAHQNNLGLDLL